VGAEEGESNSKKTIREREKNLKKREVKKNGLTGEWPFSKGLRKTRVVKGGQRGAGRGHRKVRTERKSPTGA